MYTEALVSSRRIEQYLNASEMEESTKHSDQVSFRNAAVAWPTESQEDDPDRFILRNVNLKFPAQELSVIAGQLGSGSHSPP